MNWSLPYDDLNQIKSLDERNLQDKYQSSYNNENMSPYNLFTSFGKASVRCRDSYFDSNNNNQSLKEINSRFKIESLAKIVDSFYSYYNANVESYVFELFTAEMFDKLFPNQTEVSLILLPNVLNNKKNVFEITPFEKSSFVDQITLAIIFDNSLLLNALLNDYLSRNSKDNLEVLIRDNLLLGFAAANGRLESCKILINYGANLEQKFKLLVQNNNNNNNSNQYVYYQKDCRSSMIFTNLEKYQNKEIEITPLGLVIAAAPSLSQEKAKEIIRVFLDAGADYNYKVLSSWNDTYGYYNEPRTVSKSDKISLYNFDQTGLLSIIINERKANKLQQSSHQKPQQKTLHQYNRQLSAGPSFASNTNSNNQNVSATGTQPSLIPLPTQYPGESEVDFLKRENSALKGQFHSLWVEINKLQQRMDEMESRNKHQDNTGVRSKQNFGKINYSSK